MQKLLDFLTKLADSNLQYSLECNRGEAIMVLIAVPGERWEVEFFADGNVEVEVFKTHGGVKGESELDRLFKEFSD
ncbi:MAG: hypothetical protein JXR37_21350 [Kiritimatiellae bacterium]|nr:hypothetical protein [Kiritimatiellia bacterium]